MAAALALAGAAACGSAVDMGGADAAGPITHALSVVRGGGGAGMVASSPGGIACGTDCEEAMVEGAEVSLTATPDATSTFAGWSGDCTGAATTCAVTMSAGRSVTATFERVPGAVTLTFAGTGGGQVTSSPAGIDCRDDCSAVFATGTVVTLTATPDATSELTRWTGACSGAGQCVIMAGASAVVGVELRRRCQAAPTVLAATGSHTITVPENCAAVVVKAWGGGGGAGSAGSGGAAGGGGGFASARVLVTPAEGLAVHVAGGGGQGALYSGGGGGGASAVMRGAAELVVAGGGGGGSHAAVAGGGGGLAGADGAYPPQTFALDAYGRGASQTAAGAGGTSTTGGASGVSGAGPHGGAGGRNRVADGTGGQANAGGGHGNGGAGGTFAVSNGGGGGGGGGGHQPLEECAEFTSTPGWADSP